MKPLKQLSFVFLILFIITVLVMGRSLNKNRFRENTGELIKELNSKNFTITPDQLNTNLNEYILIDLESPVKPDFLGQLNSIRIPFNKLAGEELLNGLRKNKSGILLYSDDEAVSAKAWVILNQMGYKKIYILESNPINDSLQYPFRTDSLRNN